MNPRNKNLFFLFTALIAIISLLNPNLSLAFDDPLLQDYHIPIGYGGRVKSISQGAGIVVAVIDDGVWQQHPDLAGAMWTNPKETARNGKDNDGNNYTDDYYGYNFINDSIDVTPKGSHGTMVAGIIAAQHNDIGIAGIAPKAKIMSLIACTESGCSSNAVIEAMHYAIDNGADVINLSLGGVGYLGYSTKYDAVIKKAWQNNVAVVTSAGNGDPLGINTGSNLDFLPVSPASNNPGGYNWIFAVGAAKNNNSKHADWSNYGADVDVWAQGEFVLSTSVPTYSGKEYEKGSGTSFSAPMVSGALALLKARYPKYKIVDLENALEKAQYLDIDKTLTNYVYDTFCRLDIVDTSLSAGDTLTATGYRIPSDINLRLTRGSTSIPIPQSAIMDAENLVIKLSSLNVTPGTYYPVSDKCTINHNDITIEQGEVVPEKKTTVATNPPTAQPVVKKETLPAPTEQKTTTQTPEEVLPSTTAKEPQKEVSSLLTERQTGEGLASSTTEETLIEDDSEPQELDKLLVDKIKALYKEAEVTAIRSGDEENLVIATIKHSRKLFGIFSIEISPEVVLDKDNVFVKPKWLDHKLLKVFSW